MHVGSKAKHFLFFKLFFVFISTSFYEDFLKIHFKKIKTWRDFCCCHKYMKAPNALSD